jgi:small subunit ribosomal protein S16
VAVKIRLKRMGKIRAPFYRVVVMDSRTKRDGRAIEEIGKYHPTEQPSLIDIDIERAHYWLGQGAQPTEAVAALIKLVDAGKVETKAPKTPKKDLYEAAIAAAGGKTDAGTDGPTPRKKAAKKAEPKAVAKADEKADEKAEAPAAAAEFANSAPANEDGSAPEGYTVKGNKDSMKFHEPDGQWYEQTVAEVWFKTAADAEAAGFVKAGS